VQQKYLWRLEKESGDGRGARRTGGVGWNIISEYEFDATLPFICDQLEKQYSVLTWFEVGRSLTEV
jgi:hypothetical protein